MSGVPLRFDAQPNHVSLPNENGGTKTEATERRRITEAAIRLGLGRPEIRLRVTADGETVLIKTDGRELVEIDPATLRAVGSPIQIGD